MGITTHNHIIKMNFQKHRVTHQITAKTFSLRLWYWEQFFFSCSFSTDTFFWSLCVFLNWNGMDHRRALIAIITHVSMETQDLGLDLYCFTLKTVLIVVVWDKKSAAGLSNHLVMELLMVLLDCHLVSVTLLFGSDCNTHTPGGPLFQRAHTWWSCDSNNPQKYPLCGCCMLNFVRMYWIFFPFYIANCSSPSTLCTLNPGGSQVSTFPDQDSVSSPRTGPTYRSKYPRRRVSISHGGWSWRPGHIPRCHRAMDRFITQYGWYFPRQTTL